MKKIVFLVMVLATTGCASFVRNDSQMGKGNPRGDVDASGRPIISETLVNEGPTTKSDLTDNGTDLSEIPLEVNRLVLQWIDYFQGRGRPHMERYLARSTRYMPLMKEVLKKQGLPEDLVYIALIESGFSPGAHSSAGAVGYWQFIRGTGKRYGLEINSYIDDRRDFVKSTHAAADYFNGLYNLFGSWYLAIASYNVGENRVKSLVMKYHTRDFWQLAREGKLPNETSNYIPKFIAARLIAKSPEKYGFKDIDYQPALSYAEINATQAIDMKKLADQLGIDFDDLRRLNPAYKKGVIPLRDGKALVRVPPALKEQAIAAAQTSGAPNLAKYARATSPDDVTLYKVRRGDNIASIARKFGTTTRAIRQLNRMSNSSRLIAGHKIKVPDNNLAGLARPDAAKDRGVASKRYINKRQVKERASKVHIVRRGETLLEIARKHNISLTQLARRNQIVRKSRIAVGARLEIPD